MTERIEIELSKIKLFLLLVGAGAFVVGGLFFIFKSDQLVSSANDSPGFVQFIGIIAVAFFGIIFVFLVKKMFDKKIGLIIDENGITDHSGGTSIGLIEWDDIIGIKKLQISSTKILMILTNKPEKYIEKATNFLSKKAMKANHKLYGSPLSIISNSLKIKFDDLERLLLQELEKRGE